MALKERAKELIKKLHEEMNTVGKYNTYVITEDIESGNIYTMVNTASIEITQEEKLSFVHLMDKIKPYIIKRTQDFKAKHKQEATKKQTSIKSLRIDKLIGQLVVVNIPNADNKNLNPFPEYLAEQVKKALVSVLLEGKDETYTDKGTSQKEYPCNTPES